MMEFLVASAVMGGMGVLLAALLAIADKKLYVWEDPRIDAGRGAASTRQLRRLRIPRMPYVRGKMR